MSHNLKVLITVAAELRSVGHNWDYVAKALNRAPGTCMSWCRIYKEQWDKAFREAQARRFHQTCEEAHTILKHMIRNGDRDTQLKACGLWLKCGAAVYGQG